MSRIYYAVERSEDCSGCSDWRLVRVVERRGYRADTGAVTLGEERTPVATARFRIGIRLWLWWNLPRDVHVIWP